MLGWVAAAMYLMVSGMAFLCANAARLGCRRPSIARVWLFIALLFAVLALSRWFAVEEHLRAMMRLWLAREGEYQSRRSIQTPLTAGLLSLGGLVGIAWLLGVGRNPRDREMRSLAWACRGAIVMVGLVALRLISLHATDALLYAPLHLNWVIDLGASLVVAVSAFAFLRAQGGRHAQSEGRRRRNA